MQKLIKDEIQAVRNCYSIWAPLDSPSAIAAWLQVTLPVEACAVLSCLCSLQLDAADFKSVRYKSDTRRALFIEL